MKQCEENRCRISIAKSDLEKADAILFSGMDMSPFDRIEVPSRRTKEQIYIYMSMEASHQSDDILKRYSNFFNWTMTYRRNSDVFVPYGEINRHKVKRKKEDINFVSQDELSKKKTSVFISSHCNVWSKRDLLVKQLEQYLPVDVYGKCGTKKCGQRSIVLSVGGGDLEDDKCNHVIKDYAFYFAFENTLCTEYVTEKFFRPLKLGVVPVVYGGANYSSLAPPKSFIDVRDFGSVERLAEYLKSVASNATLYNEYLKWQEEYDVDIGSPYKPLICDLCKKLHSHTPSNEHKAYKNIEEWMMQTSGRCFEYEDFFS